MATLLDVRHFFVSNFPGCASFFSWVLAVRLCVIGPAAGGALFCLDVRHFLPGCWHPFKQKPAGQVSKTVRAAVDVREDHRKKILSMD